MKILITRPIEEAKELAVQLLSLGYEPLISPLLEIEYLKEIIHYENPFLITSKNAIYSIRNLDKNIRLFVLGRSTANYLKYMGFENVCYLGNSVAEVKQNLDQTKKITYLSGKDVTDSFAEFPNIKREIVYNAKQVQEVPKEFFDFFQISELKLCLIFSSRTAEIFQKLVNQYDFRAKCGNIILLALSSKIANSFTSLKFNSVYIAKEAEQQSLISLLKFVQL